MSEKIEIKTKDKIKVLIIDDDVLIRTTIADFLIDAGYEVITAEDGKKGLDFFLSGFVDIIFVDLKMPYIGGHELITVIREKSVDIPIIAISGKGSLDDAIEALKRGAWDYLSKPIMNMNILEHIINNALEKSKLQIENRNYRNFLEKQVGKQTLEIEHRRAELERINKKLQVEIEEKAKKEKLLIESEEKFRQMAENSGEIFWLYDINEKRFLFISPIFEDIWGLSRDEIEVEPEKLKEFIHGADFDNTVYSKNFFTNKKINYEYRIVRPDKQERWIKENSFPVKNSYGETIRIAGISADVTNEKKMELENKRQQENLIQADKMVTLGTLVSGVAHEINNPNNYVMFNSSILLKFWNDFKKVLDDYYSQNGDVLISGLPYSEVRENFPRIVNSIMDGSSRIKHIVNSLKDFARKNYSGLDQNVDINSVVDSSVTLMNSKILKATDNFRVEKGAVLKIRGNYQQLEQVVINLIDNACYALKGKNDFLTITTGCNFQKRKVFVEIKDSGKGMDSEVLKHILDPFFTTKREDGGTGLGLSISYNIVREHNGTIEFNSKPEEGTTVVVTLPVTM